MPVIHRNYQLQVTPEQFVFACSPVELYDTWLLMMSPAVQEKLAALFPEQPSPSKPVIRQHQFKSLLEQAKTHK